MKDRLKQIIPDQSKDTGLALILILLIVTLLRQDLFLVVPAIIALVITMSIPAMFKPLAVLWFGLSHFMGEIVSKIVLTVVFFLVVTPIALIRKAAAKDSMGINKWKDGSSSAFLHRDHKFKATDLEKPF